MRKKNCVLLHPCLFSICIRQVENLKGSGRVNASLLRISWPYAQQDNQYLLYLVEPPHVKVIQLQIIIVIGLTVSRCIL